MRILCGGDGDSNWNHFSRIYDETRTRKNWRMTCCGIVLCISSSGTCRGREGNRMRRNNWRRIPSFYWNWLEMMRLSYYYYSLEVVTVVEVVLDWC